jgi:hypothetical protein
MEVVFLVEHHEDKIELLTHHMMRNVNLDHLSVVYQPRYSTSWTIHQHLDRLVGLQLFAAFCGVAVQPCVAVGGVGNRFPMAEGIFNSKNIPRADAKQENISNLDPLHLIPRDRMGRNAVFVDEAMSRAEEAISIDFSNAQAVIISSCCKFFCLRVVLVAFLGRFIFFLASVPNALDFLLVVIVLQGFFVVLGPSVVD